MSETSGFDGYTKFLYKFASQFVKDKSVLDVGCGIGKGTAILASNTKKNVLGIDYSQKAIKQANRQAGNNLSFLIADIRKDFINEFFDIIVLFNAIEHFDAGEQKMLLNQLKAHLDIKGMLLIVTNNKSLSSFNPYHKNELTANDFMALCKLYSHDIIFFGISLSQKLKPGFNPNGKRNKFINLIFRPKFMQSFIQPLIPRFIKDFVNYKFLKLSPPVESDFTLSDNLEKSEYFLAICRICLLES